MSGSTYEAAYRRSMSGPGWVLGGGREAIHWIAVDCVLDDSRAPLYRWFVGGVLIRVTTRLPARRAGAR